MWRSLFPRLSIVTAAFLVGACAGTIQPANRSFERAALDVFGDGYQHIYERHLNPVRMDSIALEGLKGVHELDPGLTVARTNGVVELTDNGARLAAFPAPTGDDVDGWARVTVEVIEAGRKASPKLSETTAEHLYEVVFDSALASLDGYSHYATAEEAREDRARRDGFGGIGVRVQAEDDAITVLSVIANTPAARAGMRAGDVIVRVDGRPIAGLSLRQTVRRLRGPRGSTVQLSVVRHESAQPIELSMTRRHIVPDTVTFRREGDIAYIAISYFNQQTSSNLAKAVRRARQEMGANLKGMILDLRNNPGGLLDQAVAVSDTFLTGGRIVLTRGRHPASFQQFDAGGRDLAAGIPMVVLVNGRSASSSEIVAAALQDRGRAVVVGTNSFGKGTVQSLFRLPNDGELTLTWSRFMAPSGYALHDLGILPTVCTSKPAADADGLIRAVQVSAAKTAATLRAWRHSSRQDAEKRSALRAICPSAGTGSDVDLELQVARRLLGDPALFQQALKLSFPEMAGR